MRTLIIYASKYGCTKDCAEILESSIKGEVVLINIKNKIPDMLTFDSIIIGGSIYMGKIQRSITNFCKRNKAKLLQKKIGLFICCYTPIDNETFINDFFDRSVGNSI